MFDSLLNHGLQCSRLSCPSLSPRVCLKSPVTVINTSSASHLGRKVNSPREAQGRVSQGPSSFYRLTNVMNFHARLSEACSAHLPSTPLSSHIFYVKVHRCESWTVKTPECQRVDAFELWCWRRLLRVPWTSRRSNLSILKEINPEYSLERLLLKLKLQYFGHVMSRTDSLEKTLMLGKIES